MKKMEEYISRLRLFRKKYNDGSYKWIRIIGLAMIIVIALTFFGRQENKNLAIEITPDEIEETDERDETDEISDEFTEESFADESESKDASVNNIICDISGEVLNPGIYELNEGARLNDLVIAAGGLTPNAGIDYINRARVIFDGEKVYIPGKDEMDGSLYLNEDSTNRSGANGDNVNRSSANEGINGGRVNINTADSQELQGITGVGPATAEKIIQYRNENGPFESIEDLTNISGIGEKTFKKMKEQVTV